MNELPNVVIVMARCSDSRQCFGIRLEEIERDQWTADWAFAMKEGSAKKEGYDQTEVRGTFRFATVYPGCPYCRAVSIFKCNCGKVACWNSESHTVTCPWCEAQGELNSPVESLGVGRDR